MIKRLLHRIGTAADLVTANPILAENEIATELDTGRLKRGDGETAWSALNYESNLYRRPFIVKSVNYQITPQDNGKIFTAADGSAITFTMPDQGDIADQIFEVSFVRTAGHMVISGNGKNINYTRASGSAFSDTSISSNANGVGVGGRITLVSDSDAAVYYGVNVVGDWTI